VLVARPLVNDLRLALLGFDGSEGVARAAEWFQRFPLPEECQLRIVAVLPLLGRSGQAGRPVGPADLKALCAQQLGEIREPLAELLTAWAKIGRACAADVETGDPADTLLRIAAERRADLIVVGARGLSGRDRYQLGSVSEKVVHHARCSVLVVR
jgi:nucleotide-binding universal stress UspA family protein